LIELRTPLVLGFAGSIASGKSALSTAIAERLGIPRVSFGDFVKNEAVSRGLQLSRGNLQAIGEELVGHDVAGFCSAVLKSAGYVSGHSIVVDGIRHAQVLEALRQLCSPSRLKLVLVQTADNERLKRVGQRGDSIAALGDADRHSTEVQVAGALAQLADLIVDGSTPIEDLVGIIEKYSLCEWQDH